MKLSSFETSLFEALIILYKRSQALFPFYREMVRVAGNSRPGAESRNRPRISQFLQV